MRLELLESVRSTQKDLDAQTCSGHLRPAIYPKASMRRWTNEGPFPNCISQIPDNSAIPRTLNKQPPKTDPVALNHDSMGSEGSLCAR